MALFFRFSFHVNPKWARFSLQPHMTRALPDYRLESTMSLLETLPLLPTPPRPLSRPGWIELQELPIPLNGKIPVRIWLDSPDEHAIHDLRSTYVELFWLGVLGPSATLLIRRLATGLAHNPNGFDLPVEDTARSLGLGKPNGRHSPFVRAIHRCCIFKMMRFVDNTLEVRTHVPSMTPVQLERLPESLRIAHEVAASRMRHPSNFVPPMGNARRDANGS